MVGGGTVAVAGCALFPTRDGAKTPLEVEPYKDALENEISGLEWKEYVIAASTELWDGSLVLDGVKIREGDRILLLHEKDASKNGIWVVCSPTRLIRPSDAYCREQINPGMALWVENGIHHESKMFVVTGVSPQGFEFSELCSPTREKQIKDSIRAEELANIGYPIAPWRERYVDTHPRRIS